ncbi:MAG: hypothetical protein Q8Q35_03235 [Nanoarchaeota archaeon]|nr:hypothetical protein [Nanoarchaeota archaeon]
MNKDYIWVFSISFLLNLCWEVSHSVLYDWTILPLKNEFGYYVGRILFSTLGDALAILAIFLIINFIQTKFKYYIMIGLGLLYSIIIEIKAKMLNSWTYNEYMPLIFGLGLTPLIQIAITGVLTLLIIDKLK